MGIIKKCHYQFFFGESKGTQFSRYAGRSCTILQSHKV